MKVAVLGAGGLLGSHLSQLYPVIALTRKDCDITNNLQLHKVLMDIKPEIIINCAGIVPKNEVEADQLFRTNAIAPRFIATIADNIGAYVIHISTDCVFNGSVGGYFEDIIPCPKSIYGMSKLCGEITNKPHVTLRTSFVGFPDSKGRGLLAWANSQTEIVGYDFAWWNGLTTVEFGRILFEQVIPEKPTGIIHVFGETVSKYEVLRIAQKIFDWPYKLTKQSDTDEELIKNDKTLSTLYGPYRSNKTFEEMMIEMKNANLH